MTKRKKSGFFKREELTDAQKEAMAQPVSWQQLLFTFGFLVPFLILVFGAEWFFPHKEWVQKYLGHRGKGVIIACIFFLAQLLIWHSRRVTRKAEDEKARREEREREIGTIR